MKASMNQILREKVRALGVVARRDFVTVVFSKSFVLFLLGPVFMVLIGAMAGGIGRASTEAERPVIGLAMAALDIARMQGARAALDGRMAGEIPEFIVVAKPAAGDKFDAEAALRHGGGSLAAIVSGTVAAPELTATADRLDQWQGMIANVAARAGASNPAPFPAVITRTVATSGADKTAGQLVTAQFGQTLLFLLTMLLATMVLSNLVEEKSNKIIEVLAAAIPMDALFLGKLFAMLAVSFVGIAVWGGGIGLLFATGMKALPVLSAPAVGWPLFVALGVVYFAMAYLLLGAVYLAIGGLAASVREIQTLALPASLMQVGMFFFASYALARRGQPIESFAAIFPLTSPYTMLSRAALDGSVLPHVLALGWQVVWVLATITFGARLFRRTVMKSGPAKGRKGMAAARA